MPKRAKNDGWNPQVPTARVHSSLQHLRSVVDWHRIERPSRAILSSNRRRPQELKTSVRASSCRHPDLIMSQSPIRHLLMGFAFLALALPIESWQSTMFYAFGATAGLDYLCHIWTRHSKAENGVCMPLAATVGIGVLSYRLLCVHKVLA